MTKNRARKQATRQRAASTGERYVVAQRAVAEQQPQPHKIGRLDALTHKVPGVPAHLEGGLQSRPPRRRNVNPRRSNAPHGEPRVLVGWQNRIARLFGAK